MEDKKCEKKVLVFGEPRVDGRKFLKEIGLLRKDFTEQDVCNALSAIGKDGVEQILNDCLVKVPELVPIENDYAFLGYECNFETEASLRRQLKYTKNPMEKARIQKELSTINSCNGKHRKGKR